MKSKLVILSLLVAGAAATATAQTKEKFYSEKAKDNVFISVAGGAQVNLNPDNSFGKALTPHVSVSLGKWINPVWGFRGQVSAWSQKLNMSRNSGTVNLVGSDLVYTPGNSNEYRSFNYINTHLDGLMNLSNLLCGYNPNRVFNLSVFAGPGFTFARDRSNETLVTTFSNSSANTGTYVREVESGKIKPMVNGSVGLLANFFVSKSLSIDLEARGEVSPSVFGKFSGNSYTDGAVSLTAGLTYTFGGRKFTPVAAQVDEAALNNEINRYRSELARAQADLANAKNALANAKPVVKEVTKEVVVAGPRAIFFRIGSARIDDYNRVNIELAAKILKANPDKKYKVAGYADKATGSSSWNQKLSEKRAQNVYDALVKEGVSKDQLEYVGFGGTENMFGKNYLNRVVILE